MRRCQKCGRQNTDTADFCVYCGARLKKTAIKTTGYWAGVGTIFIGFIPLMLGIFYIIGAMETRQMYAGTLLEGDAEVQQIINNIITWGITVSIIGLVIVVIGAALIFYAKQKERKVRF